MTVVITTLTYAALLGSALMAGVFFAFSTFVMQALARVAPAHGIEVMQRINKTVINPWFLSSFMGTASIALLLAALAGWRWETAVALPLLAGALLYVVGTFGVTVVFNVPMNDALEAMDPASPETQQYWSHYLDRWVFLNHLRTVAATLATLAVAVGL